MAKRKAKSKRSARAAQTPQAADMPGMGMMGMMGTGGPAPNLGPLPSSFDIRNPMMRKMPAKMKPPPGTPGAAGAGPAGPGGMTNQLTPEEILQMIMSRRKPKGKLAKMKMPRPGEF